MASRVIYLIYRVLGILLFPVVLVYFLFRVARNRSYWPTLRQRLGILPREYQQTAGNAIWFHAVSVGEVIAIAPLVRKVSEALPGIPLFLSCSTIAGFAALQERLRKDAAGIFYAPADFVWAVRRVLRRIQPSILVIAETEIWPNLFRQARLSGASVVMVNARMSDKAAPRYASFRWFFGAALRETDEILAQSDAMRERFLRAGAPPDRVEVAGNLKYDAVPQAVAADSVVSRFFAGSKVWVAASTCADASLAEEDAVIQAFRKLTGWKLLLAPRQPDRFREVARKLEKVGLSFVRRTQLEEGQSADILLLDTVGELAGLFALADAVFMGGTLARKGGHNVLEPASFAKTITVGPHLENFREMAADFSRNHAFHQIQQPDELQPFIDGQMGERALQCASQNRGATDRALAKIVKLHGRSIALPGRHLLNRGLLFPLAVLWRWGGNRKRERGLAQRQKLPVPVISVGNITVGGTGKTPAVLHLAGLLSQAGWSPGVLTRGYGRASPHGVVIVKQGGEASRTSTGDEAQILLRSGLLSLGVGADRAEAGRQLAERGLATVLILDDGFQHVRLARDFDLVLIDWLNPFGGGELIPQGRLREPLEQLSRASAFLITRVPPGASTVALETVLRQFAPGIPVFQSRVVAQEWIDQESGKRFAALALPYRQTVAFCGLGNPASFWRTLRDLGIAPLECHEYGDHHLYTPREVRRLGQLGRMRGVEALLTTEKDAVNLCEHTLEAIHPLRLLRLRIGIAVEREEELLQLMISRLPG